MIKQNQNLQGMQKAQSKEPDLKTPFKGLISGDIASFHSPPKVFHLAVAP